MKIERKWLFNNIEVPKNYKIVEKSLYWQAYLSTEPELRIRAKKDISSKNMTYKLCIKSKGTIEREEIEKDLTKEEFRSLMLIGNLTMNNFISKMCVIYKIDDKKLTISLVDGDRSTSFCYGEIEFLSVEEANAFVVPDWFGKEVTDDNRYKMAEYWKRTRNGNVAKLQNSAV